MFITNEWVGVRDSVHVADVEMACELQVQE